MDAPMAPLQASSRFTPHEARVADALFRSYGGRLFAYFRFMLGSESGSKRAVTGTLMAAAPEAVRARDLADYGPRLFMLAHAECRGHRIAEAVGAGQHWTVVTGSGNPVLPEIARRAVTRLAPGVREAYILSAPHNHLTLPEMAEILGMGLDAAADLRAQAGLDFVRAVALCAQEAGYIQFGGADLRIRAEESLERDASQPPPPLPLLSGPAPAGFRGDPGPPPLPVPPLPVPRPLAPPPAVPPPVALAPAVPPPAALPPSEPLTRAEPGLPALPVPVGPLTSVDLPVPGAFHGGPDYDVDGYDVDGYDGEGPETVAHGNRMAEDFRTANMRTGPLRALTGPMMLLGVGGRPPRRRRRRTVLAWTGGGVAVAAIALIGWQMLGPGPDNSITLTHGSLPAAPVPAGGGSGGAMGFPTASATASPSSSATPSGSSAPAGGPVSVAPVPAGNAPAPAASSGTAPRQNTAPAAHASEPAPARSARPTPTWTRPTTKLPTPPPPATASPTATADSS